MTVHIIIAKDVPSPSSTPRHNAAAAFRKSVALKVSHKDRTASEFSFSPETPRKRIKATKVRPQLSAKEIHRLLELSVCGSVVCNSL